MRKTPLRRSPIARGSGPRPTPIDRRRKVRRRSEFARIYGSKKRVAWVKSLPCIVATTPVHHGEIQNAHTENGGMGRKADAATIVPMCRLHHDWLHRAGVASFESYFSIGLTVMAAAVERAWLATQAAA